MATWTNILDAAIASGKAWTETLTFAYRDNIIAAAQAANNAPINVTGWHPHNAVNVGDGADGLIWDHSVDGTGTYITTPDFEDGFEYKLVLHDMEFNTGTTPVLQSDLDVNGVGWSLGLASDMGGTNADVFSGEVTFSQPRRVSTTHTSISSFGRVSDTRSMEHGSNGVTTAAFVVKARVYVESAGTRSWTAGKVYMFRRWVGVPNT